jgi:hypothetical protein
MTLLAQFIEKKLINWTSTKLKAADFFKDTAIDAIKI